MGTYRQELQRIANQQYQMRTKDFERWLADPRFAVGSARRKFKKLGDQRNR